MQKRPIGTTGIQVTELGFGTGPIGNLYTAVADGDAQAAVDVAWAEGIRYFDTAPHYGLGLAERRLGAALRHYRREDYVISTKVGRLLVPRPDDGTHDPHGFVVPATLERHWDFSRDGVLRSLEQSLERLGLDSVDVVLLHDAEDHLDAAISEGYPALAELRSDGVVRAIGAGMGSTTAHARLVRETDVDVIMLATRYTLLDHSALDELLPLCAERGVAVLAAAVFNSGLLATPDPSPAATYNYAAPEAEVVDRARRIAQICREYGVTLPQAAVQLPLAHPQVAEVVLGMRDAAEVRADVALARAAVPPALWSRLVDAGLLDARVPGVRREVAP